MTTARRPWIVRWREAFMESSLGSGARHCLHVLATFMDENGHAFPSIETIARKAGVTKKTAGNALREAQRAGWITRTTRRARGGQAWRRFEYDATIPERGEVFTPPSPDHRGGEEKNHLNVGKPLRMNSPENRGVIQEREVGGAIDELTGGDPSF